MCESVYGIRIHKVAEYRSNLDPEPQRGEACGHPSLLTEKPPSVSTFICMAKPGVGGEQLW